MNRALTLRLGRLRGADDGQALVLVALGLMALLMMAALGLDVGYLHYQKQQMQKAADAAAIAGATALAYNSDYAHAALNDAASNGFANGMDGVTVTVNSPPLTPGDPFQSNSKYVEVIVAKAQPTFFMKIANLGLVNVRSRAVANAMGNASGCVYALDPGSNGALSIDSGVTVSVGCAVYVESNSPSALVGGTTSSLIVGAGYPVFGIGVVGNYSGGHDVPTPVTGIPPFTDPLGTVAAPSLATCGPSQTVSHNNQPGIYYGGINISGGSAYTFSPGMYCLVGGGLQVTGTPQITGNGVIFYLTSDTDNSYAGVTLSGNATTNLTPPTSGPLAGILFFQDRTVRVGAPNSTSSFDSSGGANFTGALYFPTTKVQFKGRPPLASYSPIVAWQVEFQGNAQVDSAVLPNNGSPIPGATLVE